MIPNSNLPRSTPEAQGVPTQAILDFLHAADTGDVNQQLHSFMLLRHGHVIAERWWHPYAPTRPHILYSLSKSFTSTAIGLLVDDGKLSVDDFVLDLLPDEAPNAPSDNLKAMRMRHLLCMGTGHATDTLGPMVTRSGGSWVRAVLEQPVTHKPGTHFIYNSGATHVLAAIVQRITGGRMSTFLQTRLYEPLGINRATWRSDPQGIDLGGFGSSATTEDIAKFGQLYLQKGVWQEQRIVSEAWVNEASRSHINNALPDDPTQPADWAQGYGYQFWRCQHNAYRGDGAFGQYCIVMPAQDAVIAITSGVRNMQTVLDLVWGHLLPALSDRTAESAQPHASPFIPSPQGNHTTFTAARVSGRAYVLEPNDEHIASLTFKFDEDKCVIIRHDSRGEQRIPCGYGEWLAGEAHFDQHGILPVAASGAWTSDDTFTWRLIFTETPFIETFTCQFGEHSAVIEHALNVSFGPTTLPTLIGHAE